MSASELPSRRAVLAAGLGLLLLLALNVGLSRLDLGAFGPVVSYGIAALQVALLGLVLMHAAYGSPLTRLFAGAGLVWLALLMGLTLADFLTREPPP